MRATLHRTAVLTATTAAVVLMAGAATAAPPAGAPASTAQNSSAQNSNAQGPSAQGPSAQATCLAVVFQGQAVSGPRTVSDRILEIRELYLEGTPFGQVLQPLAHDLCE